MLCSKECTCAGTEPPGSSSQTPNPVCTAPAVVSSTIAARRNPVPPCAQPAVGAAKVRSAALLTKCRDATVPPVPSLGGRLPAVGLGDQMVAGRLDKVPHPGLV